MNLTQRDLAARLGRRRSYVATIETGERRIDVVEFIEIARAIGVDERNLFASLFASVDHTNEKSEK